MTSASSGLVKLLPLIRIAMIASVISAGTILWFLFSEGAGPGDLDANELAGSQFPGFNIVFLGLISVVALVVMFVRRKLQEDLDLQARCVFVLVAWASAEGIGLFGAALNIWGDINFFIAGLMVMLMTFVVVPIPSDEIDSVR